MRMSRLRRLAVSDHWFFITCRLLPRRRIFSASEFDCLAHVIHERRAQHGFLPTAWVLMPDHWHAIFYPAYPLTLSTVMESIKVGATKRINRARGGMRVAMAAALFRSRAAQRRGVRREG